MHRIPQRRRTSPRSLGTFKALPPLAGAVSNTVHGSKRGSKIDYLPFVTRVTTHLYCLPRPRFGTARGLENKRRASVVLLVHNSLLDTLLHSPLAPSSCQQVCPRTAQVAPADPSTTIDLPRQLTPVQSRTS